MLIDKSEIIFSLNADSSRLTPTPQWAEEFCSVWQEFPEIFPEKVGTVDIQWSPVLGIPTIVDEIMQAGWSNPDFKKSKNFRILGSFFNIGYLPKIPPDCRKFNFNCAIQKKSIPFNWMEALSKLGRTFETDVGYVHRITDFEIHKRYLDNKSLQRFYNGLGPRSYRDPFQEFGWGNYLSERFCRRFFGEDGEKILTLKSGDFGCYSVKKDGFGIILQLTEKMEDVEHDYETFNAIRNRLKDHIGKQHFIDNTRGYTEIDLNPNAKKMVCVVVDTEEHKTPQSRVDYFKDVITSWWKKEEKK